MFAIIAAVAFVLGLSGPLLFGDRARLPAVSYAVIDIIVCVTVFVVIYSVETWNRKK